MLRVPTKTCAHSVSVLHHSRDADQGHSQHHLGQGKAQREEQVCSFADSDSQEYLFRSLFGVVVEEEEEADATAVLAREQKLPPGTKSDSKFGSYFQFCL